MATDWHSVTEMLDDWRVHPDDKRDIQKEILALGWHLDDPQSIRIAAVMAAKRDFRRGISDLLEKQAPELAERALAQMAAKAAGIGDAAADQVGRRLGDDVPRALNYFGKKLLDQAPDHQHALITAWTLALTAITAAFVAGLISMAAWHQFHGYPSALNDFLAAGNPLEILECRQTAKNGTPVLAHQGGGDNGRRVCSATWWAEPGAGPVASGPLELSPTPSRPIPAWLQWVAICAVALGLLTISLGSLLSGFGRLYSRVQPLSMQIAIRAAVGIASAAGLVALFSYIRPWL